MPTRTTANSTASPLRGELLWLHPDQLSANGWNPNIVPKDVYEKVRESLRRFGWLSPVVVRKDRGGGWEIIDGEHRWQVAKEESVDLIPCWSVEGLTDDEAKRATVILNDLHGQARPDKLADLFSDLLNSISLEELEIGFPYSGETLNALLPNPLPSNLGPLPDAVLPPARWVERTYRMPPEVAEILDDALVKARDGDEIEPWQALERIAADFLAS